MRVDLREVELACDQEDHRAGRGESAVNLGPCALAGRDHPGASRKPLVVRVWVPGKLPFKAESYEAGHLLHGPDFGAANMAHRCGLFTGAGRKHPRWYPLATNAAQTNRRLVLWLWTEAGRLCARSGLLQDAQNLAVAITGPLQVKPPRRPYRSPRTSGTTCRAPVPSDQGWNTRASPGTASGTPRARFGRTVKIGCRPTI